MEKYKLIKRYPGSPKLGTIYTKCNNCFQEDEGIPSKTFTDPEFSNYWEEIIEKNYEILLMCNPALYKDNVRSYRIETLSQESCLARVKNGHIIHSIKRLSDSEIFTIGDKVNNTTFGGNGVIKSIRNVGNNYVMFNVDFDKKYDDSDDSECFLKDLKKSKKPLFTTEDGVDIFNLDRVWYTDELMDKPLDVLATKNSAWSGYLYFSTKEKAEEYIFLNKPCLSLNDVASIYISATKPITDTTSYSAQNRKIQDLVRQKFK